jgi:amino acid adenylation domain-containing protein
MQVFGTEAAIATHPQDISIEAFWKTTLKGFCASTPWIVDRAALKTISSDAEYHTQALSLSESASSTLGVWLQRSNISVSTALQGALALLLNRYSGEDDVLFGVQYHFVSSESAPISASTPIPVRVQVPPERSLLEWLQDLQTQWTILQGYAAPLAQIHEWSEVDTGTPLFESLLVLSESDQDFLKVGQLSALTIVAGMTKIIRLQIQYNRHRFEDATITRMLGHLQTLLENIAADPGQPLAAIPLLTAAERHQLLVEWNNTRADYPQDQCIHQIFEEQVARSPDAIAVVMPAIAQHPAENLTYQELNRRANQLACQLQQRGVGPDTFVALCMERSIEMIVAILGILKAGGVYVPLDPAYPQERLAWMLEDTKSPVLLTQSHLVDSLPNHQAQVLFLDADWGAEVQRDAVPTACQMNASNLAYVNYTSGSTGRPKGVAIPHRGVMRLVLGSSYTQFDASRIFLQLAPISFDAATLEIWGALLHGGTCVLFPGNGIPDPRSLGTIIQQYRVTTLWLTAALFNTIITEAPEALVGVEELLTGGEALSIGHIRQALEWLPTTQLINGYGPTESTTFTCCYRIPRQLKADISSIPIGTPIANTQVYVLDSQLQPVPIGVAGELYIGGDGLAREYLNRPDLTQERFVPHPFNQEHTARLYKTGDHVRYLSDGTIEFIGRKDNQVKIRGYRIELGEIETVLGQHEAVRDAVVVVREDTPGNKHLVAYITPKGERQPNISQIKDFLRQRVSAYMVPATLMVLDQIPLTPNGKADRRALPIPASGRAGAEASFVAPSTVIEKALAEIWSGVLGLDQVGIEDNFFDLGGTSLLGLRMVARVQKQLGTDLPAVKLYHYPTIRALAQYLDPKPAEPASTQNTQVRGWRRTDRSAIANTQTALDGIAIIGMVGRFPGATSVEELWQNLCAGKESTTFFSDQELDASVDEMLRRDPHYVRARGIIQGAETFDAAFFGISPREAEVMDPQARVFLELAYEALETVGYTPESFAGLIGLYAGSGQNTYFERHLCGRPEIIDRLGAFQTMLANEKDFLTTRISYKLNLKGPSVSVNTACSTSLVAIIQAFQALMSEQCDLALAGGVSITTPQNTGYLYQEGGMLSPDGRCRPFDAQSQGTMFNNGAGLVVLKRLDDALADGDRVYAVIRGVGINNDGADKVSFTAPSVNGQAEAIAMAQASAGFHPESISYIETHGTATPLGDPIEIEALTQAFRAQTDAKQFCAIGSVKSNFGHLVAAAGVTGLIKAVLALKHQQIPPSVNFEASNPEINFADSPFYVNNRLADWPAGSTPRRAGVSSFGVGGTNAHVVLEEAPNLEPSGSSRPRQLLMLSAKTSAALEQMTKNLKAYLEQHPTVNLADVAHTLQRGRKAFNHRRSVVCQDTQDAIQALGSLDPKQVTTRQTEIRDPSIAFMFPGQGSQYVNMGLNLYRTEAVFRSAVDQCAEILKPLLERDLREVMYPVDGDLETAAVSLRQTFFTQPALFTIEYALAQLWQSWGIQPQAMIGHSIGEFVAACLAEVFSLEDALKLVAARGRLMWNLPEGSMLSVRLPAAAAEKRLSLDLAIAAINGPSLCVVSGPTAAIAALQQTLEAEEIICRLLHTSHAFHSPMMDPILEPFGEVVRTVKLSPPKIPFVSTVTADWITDEQAIDPVYWTDHLRATVRFAEGVQTLWQLPERVLLEVGPRTTAATLARQQAKDFRQQIAISSLSDTADNQAEWTALLQAFGQLWVTGVSINWQRFYTAEHRHRLPLPTYPFERQRYWIDPQPAVSASPTLVSAAMQPLTVESTPIVHSILQNTSMPEVQTQPMTDSRKQRLIPLLKEVLEDTSGQNVSDADEITSFLEIGLDSLSLTQVALALKKKFNVKITFRHLLEDCPNLGTLAGFIDQALPADAFPAPAAAVAAPVVPVASSAPEHPSPSLTPTLAPMAAHPNFGSDPGTNGNGSSNGNGTIPVLNPATAGALESLVAQQLQIMARQLEILGQTNGSTGFAIAPLAKPPEVFSAPQAIVASAAAVSPPPQQNAQPAAPAAPAEQPKKMFGPGAKIEKSVSNALTPQQQADLDRIIARYTARTQESKRLTQEHRRYLADPRTVSGFTPLLKEMVYPIITDRASGSKLWDVDGNEYVDLTNGFGLNFFGWSPDFVNDAVKAQLDKGIEIGPQTPLAGKVAKLVTEFTGLERVAFCNTGSEAVMAAMRLARTVTGRNTIAIFAGAYHGTFDEVIVRGSSKLKSFPAAPGIVSSMFDNILVLDYGTPESLDILRDRADELAAIMVEPVQSRRPDLQPKEFLQELRRITERSGTALIFDEVVTGFRVHPGGAQAYFGIQADLATYGKVVGGGLPIGIVAGKAEYMDALDGGFWQFGDDSIPEVGVTFFAGTFVRHPMALAAAEAVLTRLKEAGPELQRSLAAKVDTFVTHLNQHFAQVQAPIKIAHFSSVFYVTYPPELPYGGLLFYLMREKGVHIWDHRPCFFTLAHSDADIALAMAAFKESVAEMQAAGFLPQPEASVSLAAATNGHSNGGETANLNQPPVPGAKLGRDPEGSPAWYIPDPDRPGKYLQVAEIARV